MYSGERGQHTQGSRGSGVRAKHTQRATGQFRPVGPEVGEGEGMCGEDKALTPGDQGHILKHTLQRNC